MFVKYSHIKTTENDEMLIQSVRHDRATTSFDEGKVKLFSAARNLAKHPYMVREGDVSDAELSAILNGLLELFGAHTTRIPS
jgi:hypothetical protein